MRLENIVALTNARLLNSPYVNSFEEFVFDASRVKRGDIFVAYDTEAISHAVSLGAYAVLTDKDVVVEDEEIAWIRVANLDEALVRLLRFRLIEKEVVAYETNEVILELAFQVITDAKCLALGGNFLEIFKVLWGVEPHTTLLFCPALLNRNIFASPKPFTKQLTHKIEIIEKTLFETSFIFNNNYYERQLLSPFFIPYLERLLNFYLVQKIDFRLKRFVPINHFEALFVNKNIEIKEFGTSDKVVIFEQNSELIESEIEFLDSHAKWGSVIYLLPRSISNNIEHKNIYRYDATDEIVPLLKETHFHFALIIGVGKSILNTTKRQMQLTLDF
ncbi:MAG: hypothetical protein IE916_01925 [Epsilonproteobacteria bacterium]|nr:hypothetical protein [Campylobacterota bacterium]